MSLGTKVGKFVGITAALVVEGSFRGVAGLGRFGEDVAAESAASYERKTAQLLIQRTANDAKREAAKAAYRAQHKLAMSAVSEAVPA